MAYQKKGNKKILKGEAAINHFRHKEQAQALYELIQNDKHLKAIDAEMEKVISMAPVTIRVVNGEVEREMHKGAQGIVDTLKGYRLERINKLKEVHGYSEVHRED